MLGNFLRELARSPDQSRCHGGLGGTPELVATVSNAGALGSWGGAYSTPQQISMRQEDPHADNETLRAQSFRWRLRAAAPGRSSSDAGADRTRARRLGLAPPICHRTAKPIRGSTRGGDRSAASGVQLHLRRSKRRRAGALRRPVFARVVPRQQSKRERSWRPPASIHCRPGRGGGRAPRQLPGAVRAIDGADAGAHARPRQSGLDPGHRLGWHHGLGEIAEMLAAGAVAAATRHRVSALPGMRRAAPKAGADGRAGRPSCHDPRLLGPSGARAAQQVHRHGGRRADPAVRQQNDLTRPMRNEAGKQGITDYISLWAGRGAALARQNTGGLA